MTINYNKHLVHKFSICGGLEDNTLAKCVGRTSLPLTLEFDQ